MGSTQVKTLVNTTDFSDCNQQDFGHYFGGTAMIWTLPNTRSKRRVFVVGEVENDGAGKLVVTGQYLTKLKEWKHKKIAFANWHKQLSPISIRDMFFRVGSGVTLFCPVLGRTSGALRKSVAWNYKGLVHFGTISPADMTSQALTWWAFNDLYDQDRDRTRTLHEILVEPNDLTAETDEEGFIVDRSQSKTHSVQYRQKKLGGYNPSTRVFSPLKSAASWVDYLKTVKGLTHHGITFKGAA